MNQLLHACFNQFPRMVESRYDEAFLYLANRCNKRAMVALITTVLDEVNSQQVVQYTQPYQNDISGQRYDAIMKSMKKLNKQRVSSMAAAAKFLTGGTTY